MFVWLKTLFEWTQGEDCTTAECQFQFYQKVSYSNPGCFEDVESFEIDSESYIAYCENLYSSSQDKLTILKWQSSASKWLEYQSIGLDDVSCDDIAHFSDESDDSLSFLFVCGSGTDVLYYEWDSSTKEFELITIISSDYDFGSCNVQQIYGDSNEYHYYFVTSAFVSTDLSNWVQFYKYSETNGA